MISHWPWALDSERRARIAAAVPAFDEALQLAIVRRDLDVDRHQLVAALAIPAGEAAALETENLARARSLGDRQHYRAFGRGDLDLRSEHRLLQSDRQGQADVGAFAGEEAVRRDLDGDDRVAAATGSLPALAGEPDSGAVLEPLRKLEVDRLAIRERDPLRFQCDRVLEWNLQPVRDICALLRRPRALTEAAEWASARPSGSSTAEQAFEQIAEIRALGAAEIEVLEPSRAGLRPAGPSRIAAETRAEGHLGIAL